MILCHSKESFLQCGDLNESSTLKRFIKRASTYLLATNNVGRVLLQNDIFVVCTLIVKRVGGAHAYN